MADAATAAQGALGGAGTGASIGSTLYPGLGTAIGAAGGAIIGAIPGLLGDANEANNLRRIKELERLRELNALGLSDLEMKTFMERSNAQNAPQLQQLANERNRMLASSAAGGAGQGAANAAIADEQAARLQNEAALKLEEANLVRKREMEQELNARYAAKGQKDKERQGSVVGAIQGVHEAGLDWYTSTMEANSTVFGQKPDKKNGLSTETVESQLTADVKGILKKQYGLTAEEIDELMEKLPNTPDFQAALGIAPKIPTYTNRQAAQSGTPWTPKGN